MKTLIFWVLCIALGNLGFSQTGLIEIDLAEMNVVSNKTIHMDYLKEITYDNTAKYIVDLESKVAKFNINTYDEFERPSEDNTYDVNFKSEKGSIIVSYDKDGNIVSTDEHFEDIKLPQEVRETVFKSHPGWFLLETDYYVNYDYNEPTHKYYKVKIGNGEDRLSVKVDPSGVLHHH
ncbi:MULTISPECIES: hypothetical protein [Mangrovimonas]|uniref:hypothetical protein n=1 Tax=Mangrovimonas TaxID=1211036 RepID=UPI0006B4503E|nr:MULTISPECIES: hypothetical protein [Mangrovimonas]OMP29917.1 hypothetical protein BKM32_15030 [Mangrovimonas sp. DI 80]